MAPATSVGPSMPSVPALATATARAPPRQMRRQRERELLVASSAPSSLDLDRRLARGQDAAPAGSALGKTRGLGKEQLGRFTRLAVRGIGQHPHGIAETLGRPPRALHCGQAIADDPELRTRKARVARLDRFRKLAAPAAFKMSDHGRGNGIGPGRFLLRRSHELESVGVGRGIGNCRT